jgi:hypothetical protein
MEDQIQENSPESSQEQPQQLVQEQKSSYDQNMITMRKKLEAEEAARIYAERRIKELEAKTSHSNAPQQVSGNGDSHDDDIGADPDDYLQVKHFKKNASRLANKLSESDRRLQELNDRVERYGAQAALSKIPDFDQVVTDENIATLRRLYPEDVEAVMSSPNLTHKAKAMYNMINKYGIAPSGMRNAEEQIAKNKTKPSAPGNSGQTPQTPLSKLNDYDRRTMTEERRKQVLHYLEEIKRGR